MTYSPASNLLTVSDSSGNTDIENDYDDLNRVVTVTDNVMSKVTAYSYYEDGLRASMTDPENNLTEYGYDAAKRLAVLTATINSTMNVTQYNYNALGMYTSITYANNAYVIYSYDATTRWLTGLYNKDSSGSEVSTFEYTYDYVGNRRTAVLTNTALSVLNQTVTYTYDTIYQLEAETRTDSAGTNIYRNSWTYDGVGNRLTNTKDGSLFFNYAYNDGNQMISCTKVTAPLTTTIFQYDANGNPITETRGGNNWVSVFDYENRMTLYNAPGTVSDTAYTYDALSRRIGKNMNSGAFVEKYIYDGANIIADYDNSDVLQRVYVTPFLDTNLIMVQGETTYYYMQDGLGSVVNMLDGACNTINSYDYGSQGTKQAVSEQLFNRYRFTGRELDIETDSVTSNISNRYYYRARSYRPGLGRFTQRDPIGYSGGLNIYSYCGNNPVNYVDPSGLVATYPLKTTAQTLPCPFDPSNPQPAMAETLPYIIDYSKPPDDSMNQLMAAKPDDPNKFTEDEDKAFAILGLIGDLIAVGGDAVSLIPTPATVIGGYAASVVGTIVSLEATVNRYERGSATGLDLGISISTGVTGLIPWVGIFPALGQLAWDWNTFPDHNEQPKQPEEQESHEDIHNPSDAPAHPY